MLDYLMWPWLEKLPLFSKEIVPALPWTKDQFPVLYDWYKAMAEDPAVKECAYPLDWYKQFIQGYYVGKSESQLIGSDVKSWNSTWKKSRYTTRPGSSKPDQPRLIVD